jgi:hypothetical protein
VDQGAKILRTEEKLLSDTIMPVRFASIVTAATGNYCYYQPIQVVLLLLGILA